MAETAHEIERLVAMMATHGIGLFEYRGEDRSIRIVTAPAEAATDPAEIVVAPSSPRGAASADSYIRSPAVGRFAPAGPFDPQSVVESGAILGFVTAAGIRLPVVAPRPGSVLSVCHEADKPVGYDTPLFEFRSHP